MPNYAKPDLDAIEVRADWAADDARELVALVRRLQQENKDLRAMREKSIECVRSMDRESDRKDDAIDELRGRVEELTEALRALLTDAFVDDVFTM